MDTHDADADVAALRRHVGADATQDAYLGECWAQAAALVSRYVGPAPVPAEVVQRATIEVGAELYHRRNAPGGVLGQYADLGAAPVRLARDPMLGAYPLLDRYLPGGIG